MITLRLLLVVGLILCTLAPLASAAAPGANHHKHAGKRAAPLSVHVVAHSHDDVGWLKTVDQYFSGLNSTIDNGCVADILDSVIAGLLEDSNRKFVYVEVAFFVRWWRVQSETTKASVRQLLSNGQLEFLNGAWCMHDEATTHWVDMVDQTALGHRFLLEEFGPKACPSVGWQIDPFGHSSTQASLLTYEAGFDSLFVKRIDYQDLALRQSARETELIWQASPSAGASNGVFTGVMFWGYGAPDDFCFDARCHDDTIVDDPLLEGSNVAAKVDAYVTALLQQAATIQGNDLMIMAGDDFNWANARKYFTNLEKLMKAVNADGRLNMFYSTPSAYVAAKNAHQHTGDGITYPTKQDDFFPYANHEHAFWSGYYTSRPTLKGMVRDLSGQFQAMRGIVSASADGDTDDLDTLRRALAVAQHHDAVAGTSMQHVAYDYARRLAAGQVAGDLLAIEALADLLATNSGAPPPAQLFATCPLANVSICATTQTLDSKGGVLVLWNALYRNRSELTTVPLPDCGGWSIQDGGLKTVPSQLVHLDMSDPARLPNSAPCAITFMADLPPAGAATYFLHMDCLDYADCSQKARKKLRTLENRHNKAVLITDEIDDARFEEEDTSANDDIVISNSAYTLTFSSTSGLLTTLQGPGLDSQAFTQDWFYYTAFADPDGDGKGDAQNAGAYIMRPNSSVPLEPVRDTPGSGVTIEVTKGTVVQQVTQRFASWLTQTVRLSAGDAPPEFEWSVGAVPIEDGRGKEIVSRFTSAIASAATWSTDSNGREMQKRVRFTRPTWKLNVTEPVAGEYYPCTTFVALSDANTAMSLLVDRSQGVTSLRDGEIEVLVHRRLLIDDSRGVREPLNETAGMTGYPDPKRLGGGIVVTGRHRLVVSSPKDLMKTVRPLASRVYSKPYIVFASLASVGLTPAAWASKFRTRFTTASAELPVNVDLVTIERDRATNTISLRLAHLFAVGEDASLSQSVQVDLASLFPASDGATITSVVEMSLTANRALKDMPPRLKWNTATAGGRKSGHGSSVHLPLEGTVVTLTANQVRTFNISFA